MSLSRFELVDAADGFNESWNCKSLSNDAKNTTPNILKPKILVVDDEQRVADTLCEILAISGYDTCVAYEGWSALEIVKRFHPDYLLSDVMMPRMNGVELAIAMRNEQPAIKVLLFSGQVGISEILEAGQKRGFTFPLLAKPIHPARLLERLKIL